MSSTIHLSGIISLEWLAIRSFRIAIFSRARRLSEAATRSKERISRSANAATLLFASSSQGLRRSAFVL